MARTFLEAFGDKLRQRRLELGLSQVELARRAKLGPRGQGSISDLELGKHLPSLKMREAIAPALELSPDELEFLVTEARLEELGMTDPAFTLLFKDIPKMTPEEKQALLRVYMEDILPARKLRDRKN
jgi:transcriptional regulator with XRE-family HTH domain